MTSTELQRLRELVSENLDQAERVWSQVGHRLVETVIKSASRSDELALTDSRIPGYPIVGRESTVVDDFIAMMVDMRGSTNHLMQAISKRDADVSDLQRVHYETTALLPSIASIVLGRGGQVTEYLGDGILSFFAYSKEKPETVYPAHNAAKDCLQALVEVINPILAQRYRLPALEVGIGMAMSSALVTRVGVAEYDEVKLFGKCVYYSAKLSKGSNEIYVNESLRLAWPKQEGGKLRFIEKDLKDVKGFLVSRTE